MIENAISSNSLYTEGSTLNYSQAAMLNLTGSHGNLQDAQQLGYSSHGNIPNIILTGIAPVYVRYCIMLHVSRTIWHASLVYYIGYFVN